MHNLPADFPESAEVILLGEYLLKSRLNRVKIQRKTGLVVGVNL